ncbi:MAG: alpha/beta hydrolase [Sphingomonadales bacterium]|nr:alpha/beta hydrolase [Sphingomonadales bacterium]
MTDHISLEGWRQTGHRFPYHGHDIFYRREGKGPALLLIHGFPTASHDWHKIWPELVTRFEVIAPDMIGFGFSAKPRDYAYSLRDQATLHEQLLRAMGIAEFHILAHDYGVSVTQELMAREQACAAGGEPGLRILSVALLNGGLFPETHRAVLTQKLLLSPIGPLLSRLLSKKKMGRTMTRIFGPDTPPSAETIDDFWALIAENDGNRIMHKLIRYMPERVENRATWVGALQMAAQPLRLINGPEDPISGRHMAERFCELIPDPDIVFLERIGHYLQVEDPAGVLQAFLEFQDRIAAN